MKQRVKVGTICSHATPDGKAIMGVEERLHKKFINGNITESELRRYADIRVNNRPKKTVIVSVFGKRTVVNIREYNQIYKPQGFLCI